MFRTLVSLKPQPLVISNRHAMEELQVFLRAMGAAERHWAREISRQEANVRRLMMLEDQHRDHLKRNVLRSTHRNLKYLVDTDLLAAARQPPAPPPAETFLFYDIPAQQLSGFSVYAMARLWADPERVEVPALTLIADLQSAWAMTPPRKRAAYEQLADIFRAHLDAEHTAGRGEARGAEAKAGGARARKRVQTARRCVATGAAATPARKADTSTSTATTTPTTTTCSARWEAAAFENFAQISLALMSATLRGGGDGDSISAAHWLPIARSEWATKTTRQKRSFAAE